MLCPSTKCEPSSRIACRVAVRTAGRPSRLPSVSRMFSGVSPGWMMRAEMPSAQAEAETSSAVDFTSWRVQSPAESLSSISRSAVAESGTRSSASASTIRARPSLVESEYSRRKSSMPPSPPDLRPDRRDEARRALRRCAPRRQARAAPAPGTAPRSPRPAAHRARRSPAAAVASGCVPRSRSWPLLRSRLSCLAARHPTRVRPRWRARACRVPRSRLMRHAAALLGKSSSSSRRALALYGGMFFANARVHNARVHSRVQAENRVAVLPAGCGAGRDGVPKDTKKGQKNDR